MTHKRFAMPGRQKTEQMEHADAIVIGAGVLGCFAARALAAMDISVKVLEAREDACTGITRANSGIVYTGCDNKPGTLKAKMCVRANKNFDGLCRELGVRFRRCGSLMAAFGPRGEAVLKKKLRNGMESGVPDLKLLSREETLTLEPRLSERLTAALYAPDTGTVDPWELGLAAYENACDNNVRFLFGRTLLHMERTEKGFLLESSRESFLARTVVNCAGLSSDAVREMLEIPAVRIYPSAADYIVFDASLEGFVDHIIFHEPEERNGSCSGKGLTLVPTVDGSLLAGATERERASAPDGATSRQGLQEIARLCEEIVPSLPLSEQIRSFSALRPNPYHVEQKDGIWVPTDRPIHSFTLLQEDGLISLMGIKTPGLTCAAELGQAAAEMAGAFLGYPGRNSSFNPVRRAPVRLSGMDEAERAALVRLDPDYGEIICRCGDVSRGEIRDAIRRGAKTLDGIKRRAGTGMGCCQGARCMKETLETLFRAQSLS